MCRVYAKAVFLIFPIFFMNGCVSSREDLLNRETFYFQNYDKNYVVLGECIAKIFPQPSRSSYNQTNILPNGQILSIPISTSMHTVVENDVNTGTYYIYDSNQSGFNNLKLWIVVVQKITDHQSEVTIKSKIDILGRRTFEVSFPEYRNSIQNCMKN